MDSALSWLRTFSRGIKARGDRFLPGASSDLEDRRLAQLILGFAVAGGAFALSYMVFYLCIGHIVGSAILLINTLLFLSVSLWALPRGRVDLAGSIFVLSLISMFTLLSVIEGGVRGHAVAWLASLPVCAQLLLRKRSHAVAWGLLSVMLVGGFALWEYGNPPLPILYPDSRHHAVTFLGYLGLGLFLLVLGFLSELYRTRAMRERDAAQAELTLAVKKLERLNLEKNEFLGIAAHDLNNPLTVVQGYAELIEVDGGQFADYAREIKENTRRMGSILRDVLDVNRIESGDYPLRPRSIHLDEVVSKVVETYRKPAKEKKLTWQESFDSVELLSDPDALHQVLDNLISNAVKYARPGGELRVSCGHGEKGTAWVEVYNQGDGFSSEDLEKLFQRFTKCSTRPTGGESSNGLGLSITQKIVHAMGGEITCTSEHGSWAAFRVVLPLS